MYKLSYGLYVVTTRNAEKANGCIVNTAIQAASTPNQICVCINKANYTHDMLLKTGVFNVSVLSRTAEFPLYERFGFQSGREVDKFAWIFSFVSYSSFVWCLCFLFHFVLPAYFL